MTTSRFDIAIFNTAAKRISSFAARAVREHEGQVIHSALRLSLNPMMVPLSLPAGEYLEGDYLPIDVPGSIQREPQRRRKLTVIEQRTADCQCTVCGSPNLYTRTKCEEHARQNVEDTRR